MLEQTLSISLHLIWFQNVTYSSHFKTGCRYCLFLTIVKAVYSCIPSMNTNKRV